MYNREAKQIFALLDAGQEAKARALFMAYLAAYCREVDKQALGKVLHLDSSTKEHMWQRCKAVHRRERFNVSD